LKNPPPFQISSHFFPIPKRRFQKIAKTKPLENLKKPKSNQNRLKDAFGDKAE